jgi:hypothetical protein
MHGTEDQTTEDTEHTEAERRGLSNFVKKSLFEVLSVAFVCSVVPFLFQVSPVIESTLNS